MNVPKLRFKEFNDDWIEEKINELVELNPKNPNLPENFIYIDLESVSNGILLQEKILTKDDAPSRAQRQVKVNDILYQTVRPYQKNNLFIDKLSHLPYIASTGYAILREKNIYQKFLFNKLNTDSFVNEVLDNCTGTSYPAINSNDLGNIKIFCPNNFKEQKRIGDFLSLIDKKIELQTKKIEDLKLFKKGFIEFEFSNSNYNEINLKEILKERKAYSEKGLEFPHVTLSKDGIYDKTDRYNRDFLVKSDNKKYKITYLNDLCYNPANLKFGVICLNEYGSAIFSPIYVTFVIKNIANPKYIKYYVTRNNFINAIRKYEQGTVYERMAVAPEDFLKFSIKLPNIEIQNKFVDKLSKLDQKIELENLKLSRYIKLKKGLMQNMFV